MSFEAELRALLVAYAPLTALVGTRIVWNEIPQASADPNVSLFKITGAPGYHMKGSDGLQSSIVQINVRASTYASAIAVRNAIVDCLSGCTGTQSSIFFGGIFLRSERQASEKPTTTLYHTVQLDFDVWSNAS
mgnify:CR=1 FL=1